ncbi:MAG TPA: hypothetical protein H9681_03495 [Firmicutes bacterium]|nr:hypothetical protein [Bacillota bacterium]
MKSVFNQDGLMYKAAAFAIFVVLVVLIVLISISSANDDGIPQPNDTQSTTAQGDGTSGDTTADLITSDSTEATSAPETTAPDTTAPETAPETTAPETTAPETTASETTAPETTVPSEPIDVPVGNTPEEIAAYLAEYPDTVLGVTEDAGQEYIDKLTFLGDSTTYGLIHYGMLKDGRNTKQVWTPASGTLTLSQASFATIVYPETGEEITIVDAVTRSQPEYLVITLGVNGVSFMDEDYFKSEYKKLVESVQTASPDTKIICQSIFPVARSYELLDSINNDKIDAANKWICEVAADCGVKYLDTNSVLRDSEGWLPEEYHNGDGMHLATNSFTLELNNLRTHAWID